MEEWKALIVDKLKRIKGLVSKPEENQKAIEKEFEDIGKQIHKSFPQFCGNLYQIMLDRKKHLIDSGLKKSAERIIKEIEAKDFYNVHKKTRKIKYDLKLSEKDYFQQVHSFLIKMFRSYIIFADKCCKEVKESDPDETKCHKVFWAWRVLIISEYNKRNESLVNSMLDWCKIFNTDELEKNLEDNEVMEYQLKNILAHYLYFRSEPTWPTKAKEVVKYFKEEYKNEKSHKYWKEIDEIMKVLDINGNMVKACNTLKSKDWHNFQLLTQSIEFLQNSFNMSIEKVKQQFLEAQKNGDEITKIFLILYRYYAEKINDLRLLDGILHATVFEFLLKVRHLPASNPNIKSVLEYFLGSLKFNLEVKCYQSAFGRVAYALRDKEVIEVVLDRLKIGEGDKFLDMFSNIPVISWCASLLGAEAHSIEGDFVEADKFTTYYWAKQQEQRQLVTLLLDCFGNPDNVLEALSNFQFKMLNPRMPLYPYTGGSFERGRVNPRAIEIFFSSHFLKIINNNSAKYLTHKFSIEEKFKDEDKTNLPDNYFDKAIMDPPYGKETAQEGFGPEQGLIIAKKGLKEASRVLKPGGKIVVTLPSYKSGWEEFKKMQWREKALDFAKECGFEQINNEQLPAGRALVLLQKQMENRCRV